VRISAVRLERTSHPRLPSDLPVRIVVSSSMNLVRSFEPEFAPVAGSPHRELSCRERHAKCFPSGMAKMISLSLHGSVNFSPAVAKSSTLPRAWPSWRCGSIHGAERNGYRKRTRVRVACGGAIRSPGVGILSSHGHFGRSIVRRESLPLVVLETVLEPTGDLPCRRRLSARGARLPAATLTFTLVRSARLSAPADRTASATRRRSQAVIRAASYPGTSAGVSGGWWRRTLPDPCTRLHGV
jgi:hypothetical protein